MCARWIYGREGNLILPSINKTHEQEGLNTKLQKRSKEGVAGAERLGDNKHPSLISKKEFTAQDVRRKGASAPGKEAKLKSCTSPSIKGMAGLTLCV